MNITARVQCERELGTWTIRVNGWFVGDFWRKGKAMEFSMRLIRALEKAEVEE